MRRANVRRTCFYHAGCPDGFGAAYAVWRSWGNSGRYLGRNHDDRSRTVDHEGDFVVFVDIAPGNRELRELGEAAAHLLVLDHHLSARSRFESDPSLQNEMSEAGHLIRFDLSRSGAMLAWRHFHPDREPPPLLRYVEDQDLWNWALPQSAEVNAAVGAQPHDFAIWQELAERSSEDLAREGAPIVRAQRQEIQQAVCLAHPLQVGDMRVEAVNASQLRSHIGHDLSKRRAFGNPIGVVYRVTREQVDVSIYSIGEVDVSLIAERYGGGGHRNASGFSLPLARWEREFL